jgi:hypothetical protein
MGETIEHNWVNLPQPISSNKSQMSNTGRFSTVKAQRLTFDFFDVYGWFLVNGRESQLTSFTLLTNLPILSVLLDFIKIRYALARTEFLVFFVK